MSATDLTRWNRAGLRRLRYVDGNAVLYLDDLLAALRSGFRPRFNAGEGWLKGNDSETLKGETGAQKQKRLAEQYTGKCGDWGVELARALARASHVLTEYIDAYANEATLRTATQWDNLRRLVEMLNYHPAPPASAATPLVIAVKPGKRGRLAKGFAVKHVPADGSPPVVFETLADLEVDAALNELRLANYDRAGDTVASGTLVLAERVSGLKLGEPVVLENERTHFTLARLISGIQEQNGRTVLTLNTPVGAGAGLKRGEILVHLKPSDRLAPLAPVQAEETVGNKLMLAVAPDSLRAGDVVFISDGAVHYYRRVSAVEGQEVRFSEALNGPLRLDQANVSRARSVSVVMVDERATMKSGVTLSSFKTVGDLSAFGPPVTLADYVIPKGQTVPRLKRFEIVSAKYQPVDPANPAGGGYTTFTVVDPDEELDNPQAVYLPPAAREWRVDSYLHDAAGGLLPRTLTTALPKGISAGDLAVVVSGSQLGWAALDSVAADSDAGRAELGVQQWHTRASGRFYLSRTRVYGRFKQRARLDGWNYNAAGLDSLSELPIAADPLPELLVIGRRLWIEQQRPEGYALGREATVVNVKGREIVISPALEVKDVKDKFTVGNTVIRANVAAAGHGETQNERILGSGDAASLNQSFVLDVAGVSFVADPTQASGVRADIEVIVDGLRWQQVSTLDDSGPGDAQYAVRMTEAGHVRIDFGDGTRARRLPSGTNNVRVRYRQGTGLAGNLAAGKLEKPARPHPLVDKLRQPLAASGGGDMENTESLRRNAPASVLTLERAVSITDYAHLAATHAAVWRARAFALPSALRRTRVEVVVVPAGGAALGATRTAIENFLATHSQPGVEARVSEFAPVWLYLEIRLRIVSAEVDAETVKAQAAARLKAAFALEQREIGAPFYLSDVYAVIEPIPGVRNSSCVLKCRRAGDATPQSATQRIGVARNEVVFLDAAAYPDALRIECEEFEL